MYEELVERLHQRIALTTAGSPLQDDLREAADAIKELGYKYNKALSKLVMETADRRHSEWKRVIHNIRCQLCGFEPWFNSKEPLYAYCPNCGAKMDGGKEDV